MGVERLGDLEISQDLAFERRSWRVQRVGWALFGLVLLAAALGLLGGAGPLSTAVAGRGSPLAVSYARFTRHNNPTELTIVLGAGAATGDEAHVWVSSAYLAAIQIERIEPEPERVVLGADRVTYVFPLDEGGGGRVVIHVMPQGLWLHEARVGLADGPEHRFSQFTYP